MCGRSCDQKLPLGCSGPLLVKEYQALRLPRAPSALRFPPSKSSPAFAPFSPHPGPSLSTACELTTRPDSLGCQCSNGTVLVRLWPLKCRRYACKGSLIGFISCGKSFLMLDFPGGEYPYWWVDRQKKPHSCRIGKQERRTPGAITAASHLTEVVDA